MTGPAIPVAHLRAVFGMLNTDDLTPAAWHALDDLCADWTLAHQKGAERELGRVQTAALARADITAERYGPPVPEYKPSVAERENAAARRRRVEDGMQP